MVHFDGSGSTDTDGAIAAYNWTFGDHASQVEIVATDRQGNQAVQLVAVQQRTDHAWPLPYTADWEAVNHIQEAAQVVDGRWHIQDGNLRPIDLGYDRLVDRPIHGFSQQFAQENNTLFSANIIRMGRQYLI